jgi:hypothetical protein
MNGAVDEAEVTLGTYEVVSKIFQTGATTHTAVVVVQSNGRW